MGELDTADKRDPGPATNVRYITLAWLCSLAMLAYIQRNAISLFEGEISAEFQLTQFQMGLVFGSFFWAYAFAQVPAGWLGQRWCARIALAVCMGDRKSTRRNSSHV